MQTASTGSGFTGVEAPSPAGRAPSIGALITEAYALPLAHPLQCGSCALVPFIMFSIALLLLSKVHGGALALLTLPIFAIAAMEIDLGELMSALKGGRLPSGLGGKLELHLEGDAAFLKDTCRFNYERYGVHVLLLTSWPKARVLQCAREMERRRAAAVAAAANLRLARSHREVAS